MKAIQRARANKQLAVAKELIGHTHAPLIITNKASCSVEGIFNELKRVFVGDNIAYKGKGKQTDLTTVCKLIKLCTIFTTKSVENICDIQLKVNYKLRMERAKKEAEAEVIFPYIVPLTYSLNMSHNPIIYSANDYLQNNRN